MFAWERRPLTYKKTLYCIYSNTHTHTKQCGWYSWGLRQEALRRLQRGGLFPSSALMPNEGTRMHRGNPRRRGLIPPGGGQSPRCEIRLVVSLQGHIEWFLHTGIANGMEIHSSVSSISRRGKDVPDTKRPPSPREAGRPSR